jgi:hypothetical protein
MAGAHSDRCDRGRAGRRSRPAVGVRSTRQTCGRRCPGTDSTAAELQQCPAVRQESASGPDRSTAGLHSNHHDRSRPSMFPNTHVICRADLNDRSARSSGQRGRARTVPGRVGNHGEQEETKTTAAKSKHRFAAGQPRSEPQITSASQADGSELVPRFASCRRRRTSHQVHVSRCVILRDERGMQLWGAEPGEGWLVS